MRSPRSAATSAGALLVLVSAVAYAHERFIKHDLKVPLDQTFFIQAPGRLLGVNPNIWLIAAHAFAMLALVLVTWFLRQPLVEFVEHRLLSFLRGRPQYFVHNLICFFTDQPVRSRLFHGMGEWAVIFFMRSPALVLMYSATKNSLVMPSFPLERGHESFFQFAQVILGLLILTQTLLPLCGAAIMGIGVYLTYRHGPLVSVDAIPVLTAGAVYLTSPWQSHRVIISSINRQQMRWVRLVLGAGFLLLGWAKVINHNLTAGVADNYPAVVHDPMLAMLAIGTDPHYLRECWIVSFGMAEVLTGFLLMTGCFTRGLCLVNLYVFTKLMVVDFGWGEIVHMYPIGALLAVLLSNQLASEFDLIESVEERLGRRGHTVRQMGTILFVSLAVAFLLIFVPHYPISMFNRYNLG